VLSIEKTKVLAILILFSIVFLLAACGGQFESYYEADEVVLDDFEYVHEPEEDDLGEADVETPEIEEPVVDDEDVADDKYMPTVQFEAWQEAYAELLRDYATRSIGEHYGISGEREPNPPGGGEFMLFDIDGDGVPELIVVDRFHFTTYVAAYTFIDGLQSIEVGYFYDYGTMFSPPFDGRPGLAMESNEGIWNSAAILVIEDGRLVPQIRLHRGENSEGDWEVQWHINDELVTEEEHDRLYNELFGGWYMWYHY